MPRTIVVKKKTSFNTLAKTMLDARVRESQAEEALTRLRKANPHVEAEVAAGTVIVIPDTPGLKLSVGEPASKAPRDSLKALVERAIEQSGGSGRARLEARSARRAELTKTINSAAFKRTAAAAQVSPEQLQEAAKALAEDDRKDKEAEARQTAMRQAALDAMARLDKLVG